MRDSYHEELDAMSGTLVVMTDLAGVAVGRATSALLHANAELAESVIAADETIDQLRQELDVRAFDLLARQQPVACDLRRIFSSLRIGADVERMGDLARHIAQIAVLRSPGNAVPDRLEGIVGAMGRLAQTLAEKTGAALAALDTHAAGQLPADDNAMDELHRVLLAALVEAEPAYPLQAAIDTALLGRYYERYADHAVNACRRLLFQVTGEDGRGVGEQRAGTGDVLSR